MKGREILAEAESKQRDNFLSGLGMTEPWRMPLRDTGESGTSWIGRRQASLIQNY